MRPAISPLQCAKRRVRMPQEYQNEISSAMTNRPYRSAISAMPAPAGCPRDPRVVWAAQQQRLVLPAARPRVLQQRKINHCSAPLHAAADREPPRPYRGRGKRIIDRRQKDNPLPPLSSPESPEARHSHTRRVPALPGKQTRRRRKKADALSRNPSGAPNNRGSAHQYTDAAPPGSRGNDRLHIHGGCMLRFRRIRSISVHR